MSNLFFDEKETENDTKNVHTYTEEKLCLGHDGVEEQLLKLYNTNHFPHALIFSGIKGIGKFSFAKKLTTFLLKESAQEGTDGGLFGEDAPIEASSMFVSADDPVSAKVSARGHPDYILIERPYDETKNKYKGNVDVQSVRKIAPFMRMTASTTNGWRIAIIDDADTMNRNAQNALLKILEEPPEKAILILVTHRIGALIPTIRSRSRVINFKPLPDKTLKEILNKDPSIQNISEQNLSILCSMADGSVGSALSYANENALDTIQILTELLEHWPEIKLTEIHSFADSMSRPGQDNALKTFENIIMWCFQKLTKYKAKNQLPDIPPLDSPVFQTFYNQYSLEDLMKICDSLKEHFDTCEFSHLDRRHTVMGAISILKQK